jgi:hypothetical protein
VCVCTVEPLPLANTLHGVRIDMAVDEPVLGGLVAAIVVVATVSFLGGLLVGRRQKQSNVIIVQGRCVPTPKLRVHVSKPA